MGPRSKMQTARRLTQIRVFGARNAVMRPVCHGQGYASRRGGFFDAITGRVPMDYQRKQQGPEMVYLQFLAVVFGTYFVIYAAECGGASAGIIDKLTPFSFGQPRQGAYFPPHCRYITPYDDIVREHKKKQKQLNGED